MKPPSLKRIAALLAAALLVFTPVYASGMAAEPSTPYRHGTPGGMVCLTVDDGFGWINQKQILDTLRKYDVHCTFFLVGEALLRTPNYWKQAIEDGHEICYHSMYHKNLEKMTEEQIQQDIDQWNAALNSALPGYKSPKLARLPGGCGATNAKVMGVFARNGYQVIGWSVQDCSMNIYNNIWHIKHRMKSDSILLIHFKAIDAQGLPKYIGWLKENFNLVRVSEAYPEPKPEVKPQVTPEAHDPGRYSREILPKAD